MAKGGIDIGGVAVVGLAALVGYVLYQNAKKKGGTVNPTLPANALQTVFNLANRVGFNSESGFTLSPAMDSSKPGNWSPTDNTPDAAADVGPTIFDMPGVTTVQ